MKKEKLARFCKEKMVDEIAAQLKERPDFFVTSYMGLSNAELETLRKSLSKSSSSYLVVKNAILKIVFDKLELKDTLPLVNGGVGVSLSGGDIISTCKTLVTFSRDHANLKIKGAYLEGRLVLQDRVKELASIPSREVLLSRVVGGIKSPITGFVNVLGGVLRKFVYVVDAIKTSKQDTKSEK